MAHSLGKIDARYLEGDYRSPGPGTQYTNKHRDGLDRARSVRRSLRRLLVETANATNNKDVEIVIVIHAGFWMYLVPDMRSMPTYASLRSYRFRNPGQTDAEDLEAAFVEVPVADIDAMDPNSPRLASRAGAGRSDSFAQFFQNMSIGRADQSSDSGSRGHLGGGLLSPEPSPRRNQRREYTPLEQAPLTDLGSPPSHPTAPPASDSEMKEFGLAVGNGPLEPAPVSAALRRCRAAVPVYDSRQFKVVQSRFTGHLRQRARQIQRFVAEHGTNTVITDLVLAQAQALQPPQTMNPLSFGVEFDAEEIYPTWFHDLSSARGLIQYWTHEGRWDDWDEFMRAPPNIFGQTLPTLM
ncbi:hypothetical protein TruAng_005655 [Truncatella angustata]|nr:hypothetical protein TruAng_005655 [Truncatella angustata]